MSGSLPGLVPMSKTGKKYKERLERKVEHRALKSQTRQQQQQQEGKRAPKSRIKKMLQLLLLTGGLACVAYVVFTHLTTKTKIEKNGSWLFSKGGEGGGGGEANWDSFTRAIVRRSDTLGRVAAAFSEAWKRANTVRDGLWAGQLRSFTAGIGQTPDKQHAGRPQPDK